MRTFLLFLCLLLVGGCAPSAQSLIDKAAAKAEAKKKVLPKGVLKPEDVGIAYFPGADLSMTQSSEHDEGGFHIQEVILSASPDQLDEFRDFYEKELKARAMPTVKPCYSIQNDRNGRHYEVNYMTGQGTIGIKVYTPQQP